MKYDYGGKRTVYRQVEFRSRLEATWAAFFDQYNFVWEYEPIDLPKWSPDFYLKMPCGHSECPGYHDFFCEVKPYATIEEFKDHECMKYAYGGGFDGTQRTTVDGYFALGLNWRITQTECAHGSGGGYMDIVHFLRLKGDPEDAWRRAGRRTSFTIT